MQELPYPIRIAKGALGELREMVRSVAPRNRCVAITSTDVWKHCGSLISTFTSDHHDTILRAPMSERLKTREMWAQLTDSLLDMHCGRDTTLISIGGGVVGDIVGFVAATYMRGIPYVQVPTTLLAMVDASIGGKTGVDTPAGKNLVGAFHQPAAVIIDPRFLHSLPLEQLRSGFAEIIKHGVVADADYFGQARDFLRARRLDDHDDDAWIALIARSVEIKADIVARDERESGLRKVLNFGHTIGHALEAASGYAILHGEAVAAGMIAEARIAHRLGIADAGSVNEVEEACRFAGFARSIEGLDAEKVIGFTHSDKKARDGRVEYALPSRIGEMAGADRGYGTPVDDAVVREVLS